MGDLLDILKTNWNWVLNDPVRIIATSAFGNLIVELADGTFWRVCPEDLCAEKIADDVSALESVRASDEFRTDWEVSHWVAEAKGRFGNLALGQCYCFKVFPLLNGDYSLENMEIMSLTEWVSVSGDIGNQIKDLPDGTQIRLVVKRDGKLTQD